jgi:hypothetical protein
VLSTEHCNCIVSAIQLCYLHNIVSVLYLQYCCVIYSTIVSSHLFPIVPVCIVDFIDPKSTHSLLKVVKSPKWLTFTLVLYVVYITIHIMGLLCYITLHWFIRSWNIHFIVEHNCPNYLILPNKCHGRSHRHLLIASTCSWVWQLRARSRIKFVIHFMYNELLTNYNDTSWEYISKF